MPAVRGGPAHKNSLRSSGKSAGKRRPCFFEGVESYTKKTFSPQRYEIWTMQSAWHNLPTFDGVQQLPGAEYAAREVCTDIYMEPVLHDKNNAPSGEPVLSLTSRKGRCICYF